MEVAPLHLNGDGELLALRASATPPAKGTCPPQAKPRPESFYEKPLRFLGRFLGCPSPKRIPLFLMRVGSTETRNPVTALGACGSCESAVEWGCEARWVVLRMLHRAGVVAMAVAVSCSAHLAIFAPHSAEPTAEVSTVLPLEQQPLEVHAEVRSSSRCPPAV